MASSSSPTTQAGESSSPAINVANFISTKLSGNNYLSWKEQMLCLLESQGLVRFIDGTNHPPNDDVGGQRRTDWLVKDWILGALSDEVLRNVVYLDSARDVWLELENEFSIHQVGPPPEWSPTVDVANFVPTKLSRRSHWKSYKLWKERILHLVQSQDLDGILDNVSHPPEKDDAGYSSWMQNDGKVKGWILEALIDDVIRDVVHLNTAREVWLELENDFFSSKPLRHQEKETREEMEFYKASMNGDWNRAQAILKNNPGIISLRMSLTEETALHVAVGSGSFVEELVKSSDDYTFSIQDYLGFTALHAAARTGNHWAAQILVNRLPDLLYVSGNWDKFPLHLAAASGHRETLELLIAHTRDDLPVNPFAGRSGLSLMGHCITSGFLGIALNLVNKYPHIALMKSYVVGSALYYITIKDTAFAGKAQLNYWELLLYSCIQLEMEDSLLVESFNDIEAQNVVKRIRKKKLMHEQALRLVRSICKHMESLEYERASAIYMEALLKAAEVGNHEIVEVIVGTFPLAIYCFDGSTEQNFIHMTVKNRCEKVYNLLYQTNNHRFTYANKCDSSGNSILHLAGFMAPPHKLNLVSGAALQMQREIQWFKEVSKAVIPSLTERLNNDWKTAAMIFTEEHKDLKIEGEKWMKDTANSCTIAAALIVTIVFAAAITVPGGSQSETGYPMMWKTSAFTIFAVSDAISLFTSTTSLLMFLSILTSRYAEEDFLYALPKRLGIGLVTLFLSILFMMAAFSSTVYLVFGRECWKNWSYDEEV